MDARNVNCQRIAFLGIEARLFRFALAVPVKAPPVRRRQTGQAVIETGGLNRAEQIALFIAQHALYGAAHG